MSPEALLGQDLTPKTDVYSFGIKLCNRLTRRNDPVGALYWRFTL